jgi:hypothetical protein
MLIFPLAAKHVALVVIQLTATPEMEYVQTIVDANVEIISIAALVVLPVITLLSVTKEITSSQPIFRQHIKYNL